mgnify:CR=1 FL=1
MKSFNLKEMQTKGQANVSSKVSYLIGALIVVVLATALAPEMFSNVANISGCEGVTNCTSSTPEWVAPTIFVIVGAGLIFLVWKAFGNK